jgi:type IVB pilus formation R64 PilN family outer membrane protein
MYKSIKIAISVASLVMATGCSIVERVSESNRDEITVNAAKDIKDANKFMPKKKSLTNIIFDNDFYIPEVEESDRGMPKWFFEEDDYQLTGYTLHQFMDDLQNKHSINVTFEQQLAVDIMFSLRHKGTVGDALKKISQGIGYNFDITGDLVSWTKFEVKEFDISFVPGLSSFMIGEKENANQSSENTQSTTIRTESSIGESQEYANFEANDVGPWQDLINGIMMLKSEGGSFSVSESLSTITVKDFPENVDRISRFIKRANQKLTTNVSIEVKVIEFSNTDGALANINWNLVKQSLDSSTVVEVGTNFASSLLSGGSPMLLGWEKTTGQYAGSNVIVEALEEQGTVRTVMEPRVVGLNNQIAKIDVGGEEGYLASSGSTLTSNVGASSILTPGVVETGMKLYVLPSANLDSDSVVVRMSTKFAALDTLTTVSSGDSSIQTPSVSKRDFFLTFAARNGQTLLVTGLKNTRNEYSSSTPGSILLGGSKSGKDIYTETIMLITPRIVNGVL